MFDIKLALSDILEIVAALKFESDTWADRDGGNDTRQRLIDEIFRQYRAQVSTIHPDAPDPEDFEEVIHNAD